MKKFKVFVVLTLIVTLAGAIPAQAATKSNKLKDSAKITKAELKDAKDDAERLITKHCVWRGIVKSDTTYKSFRAGDPATYQAVAKWLVNAYYHADESKSNYDSEIVSLDESMAQVRGAVFEAARKLAAKGQYKKAGKIIAIFNDGQKGEFDQTEYASVKWLYSMIELFQTGTIGSVSYKDAYDRKFNDWYPLRANANGLTRVEAIHIIYDKFVSTGFLR